MLNFWSRGKRVQSTLVFRENHRIDLVSSPIPFIGYIEDQLSMKAWHLLHDLLLPGKGIGAKHQVLPISERDGVPLDPYSRISDERKKELTDISPIASEQYHRQLQTIEKSAHRDHLAQAIKFTVLIFAILIGIFALMAFLGKVQLPF